MLVAPSADGNGIDPSRPQAATVVGRDLVLWRDGGGAWRAFADSCPHRAAPLSEGRVEGHELYCSYHGWRFDGEGDCTALPSLDRLDAADADADAAAARAAAVRATPGCRATSYPCIHRHGLVWVFLVPGADGALAAAAVGPPRSLPREGRPDFAALDADGLQGDGDAVPWSAVAGLYARDLPYSWDTLAENLTDPDHVPFAHHTLQGSRSKFLAPVGRGLGDVASDGSAATLKSPPRPGQKGFNLDVRWEAPNRIVYSAPRGDGWAGLVLLLTPTRPGWSRVFFRVVSSRPLPTIARLLLALRVAHPVLGSVAADHITRNAVMASDNMILNAQEAQALREAGVETAVGRDEVEAARRLYLGSWRGRYHTPTPSDSLVRCFRAWYQASGGLPVDRFPLSATLAALDASGLRSGRTGDDAAFGHHHLCRACAKATKRMMAAEAVFYRVAIACAGAALACAFAAGGGAAPSVWLDAVLAAPRGALGRLVSLAVVACLASLGAAWCRRARLRLTSESWIHSERY